MIPDDVYIIKMIQAGKTHLDIARKLNLTEEQVKARWLQIQTDFIAAQASGYSELCDAFLTMANQYQLLGESLKVVGLALNNVMSVEELEQLVVENRTKTIANLKSGCIVLRPFIAPLSPQQAAEEAARVARNG